jgi:hypothetical protein
MPKDKDLPAPNNDLTPSKINWIINELGRTESKLAVQTKFKQIWGVPLDDLTIDHVIGANNETINELRQAYKNSIDSHKMGDARNRMDEFLEIAKQCKEGIFAGIDKNGEAQYKQDFRTALEAIKACREEQDRERKYELELLRMVLLSGNLPKNRTITNNNPVEASEDIVEGQAPTDVEYTTDTDKYFGEEE